MTDLTFEERMDGWKIHDGSNELPIPVGTVFRYRYRDADGEYAPRQPALYDGPHNFCRSVTAYLAYEPSVPNSEARHKAYSVICEACAYFESEPNPNEPKQLLQAIRDLQEESRRYREALLEIAHMPRFNTSVHYAQSVARDALPKKDK